MTKPYASFNFQSKLWLYPGKAGWHFFTLPKKLAKEINKHFYVSKKAWGSIPLKVKINNTSWDTSIFPDKKSESFVLPIKKEIRLKEGLLDNKTYDLSIMIQEP